MTLRGASAVRPPLTRANVAAAEVAATWFDAMWADVGAMWPGMEPGAGTDEVTFVRACLAKTGHRSSR